MKTKEKYVVVDGMTREIMSWHRFEGTAVAAMEREERQFRGRLGNGGAYLPRSIFKVTGPDPRFAPAGQWCTDVIALQDAVKLY